MQQRRLWSRWKAGESLSEIGRALGKQPGSIHGVVASNGGYVPALRRRSPRVLTITEREEISRGLAEGASLRRIAGRLQRSLSSISRRSPATAAATGTGRRGRAAGLVPGPPPQALETRRGAPAPRTRRPKLAEEWSPEQISGWLARTNPGEHALQVSTETIYRSLFAQARGVLCKELTSNALFMRFADGWGSHLFRPTCQWPQRIRTVPLEEPLPWSGPERVTSRSRTGCMEIRFERRPFRAM